MNLASIFRHSQYEPHNSALVIDAIRHATNEKFGTNCHVSLPRHNHTDGKHSCTVLLDGREYLLTIQPL